jgi:hypothetical protein
MAKDYEIEFHEIKSHFFHEIKRTIMRSKVLIIFDNFVQEVDTLIVRLRVANNAF